jgi:dTDP-4-dehydrorhamnose 3,5-epimerase
MAAELHPTPIPGLLELVGKPFRDQRGAFLNAFRIQESAFAEAWGERPIAQVNISRTEAVGAIRGLHLQAPPHSEAKLEPGSELLYLHSSAWVPEAETGVRWDDPQLAIDWPLPAGELSERDRSLPWLGQFQVECMHNA